MADSNGKGKRSNAHEIIRCFYPKQFSLLRYLRMVKSTLRLRNKDDTREYRQLLSSTLVAIPRNEAVTLSQKPRQIQSCTTIEIIHRVIEIACNSKSGSTSVLALGYERLRGNKKCGIVTGSRGIQNSYPNTIVSYLKSSQPWQTLHSRIGDDLMIHLFQNLAIFVTMPSRCYLQIAGHPIGWLSPLSTDSTCRSKSTPMTSTCRSTSTSMTSTDSTCHSKSTSRTSTDGMCHSKSTSMTSTDSTCHSKSTSITSTDGTCHSKSTPMTSTESTCHSKSTSRTSTDSTCHSKSTSMTSTDSTCHSKSTSRTSTDSTCHSKSTSRTSTDSTCHSKSTSRTSTGGTCHSNSTSRTSTGGTCHSKSTSQHGTFSSKSLLSRGNIVPKQSYSAKVSTAIPVGGASPRRKKRRRAGKRWKASLRQTEITNVLQVDSRCVTDVTSSTLEMSTEDQIQIGSVVSPNGSSSNIGKTLEITGVSERVAHQTDAETSEETTATVSRRRKRKIKDCENDEEGEKDAPCSKKRKMSTGSKSEDVTAHSFLSSPVGQVGTMNTGICVECSTTSKSVDSRALKRKHDSTHGAAEQANQTKQLVSVADKTVQMAKQHRLCLRAVSRFLCRRRLSAKIPVKHARITSKNRKVPKEKTGKSATAAPDRGIRVIPFVKEANPNQMYIPRSQMFFASSLGEKLPRKHIVEVTPASRRGASKLIREIFLETSETKEKKLGKLSIPPASKEPSVRSNNEKVVKFQTAVPVSKKEKPQRLPKRLYNLQNIFVRFLVRHKSCRFRVLVRCHCPYEQVSRAGAGSKTPGEKTRREEHTSPGSSGSSKEEDDQRESGSTASKDKLGCSQDVNNHTPYHKVVQFLKAVCRKVVPKELWGSPQNEAAFLKNLNKFVRLRQHEKFSMSQMTQGFKVSACAWLRSKKTADRHVSLSESQTQRIHVIKFIWWLVSRYLMIILRSFFYITDSGLRRNHIFYYRKPVWRKIHEFGLKSLTGKLQRLTEKDAMTRLSRTEALGYSHLRFVPKANSIRPIVNMRHRKIDNGGKPISINMKLQNLFEVMKFEKNRNVVNVGSAVLGVDDIYRALKPFAMKRSSNPDASSLYFVHVDISACYDSIVQQKLYDIMENVLEEEEYLLRRFTVLTLHDGSAHKNFSKHVSEASDCQTFPEFLRKVISDTRLRDVVVVDGVWYLTEDRDKLLQLLGEHILNNIVKIGDCYYHQTRGIAQGSILSTLLCSYFYGAMERQYFPEVLDDPDSLLLRWIDDFLLVTPSRSLADKFLTVVHDGIPEFGCLINTAKTLTNYDAVTSVGVAVKRSGSEEGFPWCGFLLHPTTLEVQYDYSRYSESGPISDTITAETNVHPGHALYRKLMYSLRVKCHPLLLDPEINSRDTVVANVYQTFVLAAAKFHAFVKEMPKDHQAKDNPAFFAKTILDLASFFHSQASRRCRQLSRGQISFQLSEGEVTWLCCQGFLAFLKRKHSRYVELLGFLRGFLKRLRSVPSKSLICPSNEFLQKLVW